MKISWVEDLVKEGSVRPEVRDQIYSDCQELVKTANSDEKTPDSQAITSVLVEGLSKGVSAGKDALGQGANQLFASKMLEAFNEHSEVRKSLKDIQETQKHILEDPDISKNGDKQAKAEARFLEIAKIAPSVARNKEVASRLVKGKLYSGLSDDDVVQLAAMESGQTRPSYQKRMQDKMASEQGPYADEEMQKLGSLCAEIHHIYKEAAPKSKINKLRGPAKDFMKSLLMSSATLGGAALASGATKKVMDSVDRKNLDKKQREAFQKAVEKADPESSLIHANKDKAYEKFKTLAHFAPNMASEPSALQSFMEKSLEMETESNPNVDPQSVKELTDIEKNIRAVKGGSPFVEGFSSGLKDVGFPSAVGGAAGQFTKSIAGATEAEQQRNKQSKSKK